MAAGPGSEQGPKAHAAPPHAAAVTAERRPGRGRGGHIELPLDVDEAEDWSALGDDGLALLAYRGQSTTRQPSSPASQKPASTRQSDLQLSALWNGVVAVLTGFAAFRLLRDPSDRDLRLSVTWAAINVVGGIYEVATGYFNRRAARIRYRRATSLAASPLAAFNSSPLAVGGGHACALPGDGTVRCWGDNSSGQLGDGEVQAPGISQPPVTVVAEAGSSAPLTGVVAIAAGLAHTCGLMVGSTVNHPDQADAVDTEEVTPLLMAS